MLDNDKLTDNGGKVFCMKHSHRFSSPRPRSKNYVGQPVFSADSLSLSLGCGGGVYRILHLFHLLEAARFWILFVMHTLSHVIIATKPQSMPH